MKLRTALAMAALASLTAPALAQTTAAVPNKYIEVEADMTIPEFGRQADLVKGMDVYSVDGTNLGDVEDVIGFTEDEALAVAVDFAGNGGYPNRDDVVVPLSVLTWDNDKLILAASPAEVLAFEGYDD